MKRQNILVLAVMFLTAILAFILFLSSQKLANFYFSMMSED